LLASFVAGASLEHARSLGGGDIGVSSGSTATVTEKDMQAGAAKFNIVDNLLLPPDELASVSWMHVHTAAALAPRLGPAAGCIGHALAQVFYMLQH
jgi:hypothetical protein